MSVGHEGIVFFSTRYFKYKYFPQILKWKQNKTFWTLLADKVVCRIFWIIGTDNSLVSFPTKRVSSEGFLFVCFAFNATASVLNSSVTRPELPEKVLQVVGKRGSRFLIMHYYEILFPFFFPKTYQKKKHIKHQVYILANSLLLKCLDELALWFFK